MSSTEFRTKQMLNNTILFIALFLLPLACGKKNASSDDPGVAPSLTEETFAPNCEDAIKYRGGFDKPTCIDAEKASRMEAAIFDLQGGTAFAIDDQGLAITNFHVVVHCLIKNLDKLPPLTGKPIAFAEPIDCGDYSILATSADANTDTKSIGEINSLHFNLLGFLNHTTTSYINGLTLPDWALVKTEPKSQFLSLEKNFITTTDVFVAAGMAMVIPDCLLCQTQDSLKQMKSELETTIESGDAIGIRKLAAKTKISQIDELLGRTDLKRYNYKNLNLVWTAGYMNTAGGMYSQQDTSPDFEVTRARNFPNSLNDDQIRQDDERIGDWMTTISPNKKCSWDFNYMRTFIDSVLDVKYGGPRYYKNLLWRLKNLKENLSINQADYAEEIAILEECGQEEKTQQCIDLMQDFSEKFEATIQDICSSDQFNLQKKEIADRSLVTEFKDKLPTIEHLILDMTVGPGMSGSPVVSTSTGKVVAIIWGGDSTGRRTFTVPIKRIREELSTLGISLP